MKRPLWSIVLAAGRGSRLGAADAKQYLPLAGRPLLFHSLETFARCGDAERVLLVHPAGDGARIEALLSGYPLVRPLLVTGGATRQESVANALAAIGDEEGWVAVHDAARPLFRGENLAAWRRLLGETEGEAALLPVLPVGDTLLAVQGEAAASRVDRARLAIVQTPQLFDLALLRRAHAAAIERGERDASDDGGLVIALGLQPRIVPGDPGNFKVTDAADLARAESALSCPPHSIAPPLSGIGYDSHRIDPSRRLILGGVTVPSEVGGLAGHSDADVLTHALMDALLGAAGLGDIGAHFPDSDPAYAGADSVALLGRVRGLLAERGLAALQADCTVIAERPRLAEHIPAMRACLAAALGIPVERLSVKATTNEGMDAIGRGEGMAAIAIATVGRLR